VRVLVRARGRLPAAVAADPGLTVIEASPLAIDDAELGRVVDGCDAVGSCLGHPSALRGIFGPPRDLVTRAIARACRAIEAAAPAAPVKVVLMTSASVHRPLPLDGRLQRAFLWLLRALLPPARENQRAADLLRETIGPAPRRSSGRWCAPTRCATATRPRTPCTRSWCTTCWRPATPGWRTWPTSCASW
jgi:hypothetical protein